MFMAGNYCALINISKLVTFSKTMTVPYPFNGKNIKDPSQRPEFQFDIRDVHPFLE